MQTDLTQVGLIQPLATPQNPPEVEQVPGVIAAVNAGGVERLHHEPVATARQLTALSCMSRNETVGRRHEKYFGLVSTAFFPNADVFDCAADLILLSCDDVHFYIHSRQLWGESANGFASLMSRGEYKTTPLGRTLSLIESRDVLNVVLHTMYGIPCDRYRPDKEVLLSAVGALSKYGALLKLRIAPGMPLYSLILSALPDHAIDFYVSAAEHDLHPLAVAASTYLGTFRVEELSKERATRMGPRYHQKLVTMVTGREDMIKRLIRFPPTPHSSLSDCDEDTQELLANAWLVALADVAWDPSLYKDTPSIMSKVRPLRGAIACGSCQRAMDERLATLQAQLQALKCTI